MPPQPAPGLTPKQLLVFNYIAEYLHSHQNTAPTLREIARDLGFKSHELTWRLVNILEAKNYITKVKHQQQSIQILKYPEGGVSPAAGVPRGDANFDAAKLAYARGVAAGRRLEREMDDDAKERRGWDRGFAAGQKQNPAAWPKNFEEAFERGIKFGKSELRRELTLARLDERPFDLTTQRQDAG